ncbi:MAG: hypothetical protein AB4080_19105 [Trichodesmium sp.]
MGEGRRQETGDRRQEKRYGSEEVRVRIVRMIFLPNSCLNTLLFEREELKTRHWFRPKKGQYLYL